MTILPRFTTTDISITLQEIDSDLSYDCKMIAKYFEWLWFSINYSVEIVDE